MGCCACIRGLFLTLLSIITCGVLFAFMLIVVIVEKTKKFDQVSKTVFIVSIVICVLTGLLLLFAIYASCCGKRCAKGTLGVVFLVFMLILIAFAACVWGLKKQVMDWIGENYESKELYLVVPEIVDCCNTKAGWWSPCMVEKKMLPACKDKFEDLFAKFGNIVGAIAIILAVLLLVGAIICFCACSKRGGISYS